LLVRVPRDPRRRENRQDWPTIACCHCRARLRWFDLEKSGTQTAALSDRRGGERGSSNIAWQQTDAWFDRAPGGPETHGNPIVLKLDRSAPGPSQACIPQTCLVEVVRFDGALPPINTFVLPTLMQPKPTSSPQSDTGRPSFSDLLTVHPR
jgi:hypothetical protein